MKSSSKRRFLPINSGWKRSGWKRDCQSDRPFTPFPCGAAHNAGEGGLMSISRSRDCIHSSCSGHSSSSSRNRADCSFRWGSEGVGRVVDRWMAYIFAANHAKRPLVPSLRIDRSLPRVRRRRAVRLELALRARYCSVHVWPLGGQCGLPLHPGELHEETK